MTCFPRQDTRPLCNDGLHVLYVVVAKIPIAPVEVMIRQWFEYIKGKTGCAGYDDLIVLHCLCFCIIIYNVDYATI